MTKKEAEKAAKKEAPIVRDPYDMDEKLRINPKADAMNFMETRGPIVILCCGSDKSKKRGIPGAKCRSYAGQGTDHPGYGRCKFCGGRNRGPSTPEAKAKVSQNGTKHGLYKKALGDREAEIFEELHENHAVLSLEFEINMQKAKILGYLEKQKALWQKHYDRKLAEHYVKYRCTCGKEWTRRELEAAIPHCYECGTSKKHAEIQRGPIENTHDEAEDYANRMSKVYFSEGESKSFYHAATIEDRALDRAINTLGRLVERHARIKGVDGDNLMDGINAELRAASQGQVTLSWGEAPAQGRKGE